MAIGQSRILGVKTWQNLFIKSDPSYGNLIASVLQTIFKNKYISLLSLIKSIESNSSILISGEGALDLLPKYLEPLIIIPKYYISNNPMDYNSEDILESIYYEAVLNIRCDFLITFDKTKVSDLSEEFMKKVDNTIDIVRNNNRNIIINYLLKMISEGQYFIPQEFLEKGIFEEKIPKTKYSIKDIFNKFNINETNNFNILLNLANRNSETNETESNMKILNIPFTAFHINNYLTRLYQDICRKKYNIGKSDLHVKFLFLNSEYFLSNSKKTVYEILAENTYYEYFFDSRTDDLEVKENIFKTIKDRLLNDINALYKEIFNIKKNNLSKDMNSEFDDEPVFDVHEKGSIKKQILRILKNDKTPTRELAILNSLDVDRLLIKKTFIDTLKNLSNPFLNKVIDTSSINLLKQYLVSNYGDNFKDNISNEVSELIEKKLLDFIKSTQCNFIEYFSQLVAKIAEATGEKEAVVENVILNSYLYKNFFFIRFLKKSKSMPAFTFHNLYNQLNRESYLIMREGNEDDKVIIPFIKIKEFLIYLLSEEITIAWEKLSGLFDEILQIISQNIFKASQNKMNVTMFVVGQDFNITIKENQTLRDFQIQKIEEIEYVFQDIEHDKLKTILSELYNLHQRTGFGFDNKKDFNELIQVYYKRQGEYFLFKSKSDRYYELTSDENILTSILKKIFFWLPRALNELRLRKVTIKNKTVEKKASYHYINQKTESGIYSDEKEILDIKDRISSFIDFNKKVENTILNDAKKKKIEKSGQNISVPALIEADDKELKLFDFIKIYIKKNKNVIFTHNPDLQDEQVVIYVKDNVNRYLLKKDTKELNTIDEYSTRYFLINNLIKKHYLVKKEFISLEKNKKMYGLYFSPSYIFYNPD
ncbi:MAG: hypothetical protein JXB50_06950 [Spirochaetes bacterium]|nr:hypothetical protein [Spirochaetota bacterium]